MSSNRSKSKLRVGLSVEKTRTNTSAARNLSKHIKGYNYDLYQPLNWTSHKEPQRFGQPGIELYNQTTGQTANNHAANYKQLYNPNGINKSPVGDMQYKRTTAKGTVEAKTQAPTEQRVPVVKRRELSNSIDRSNNVHATSSSMNKYNTYLSKYGSLYSTSNELPNVCQSASLRTDKPDPKNNIIYRTSMHVGGNVKPVGSVQVRKNISENSSSTSFMTKTASSTNSIYNDSDSVSTQKELLPIKGTLKKPASNVNIDNEIFSSLIGKKVSLLPARSSSFCFNNREIFYAVNTTNGLIRSYNEDRVSIVINIRRKNNWNKSSWPQCSYFGIFDGHGGSQCADFLKDNLHHFVLDNLNFPADPEKALEEGCIQAEEEFLKMCLKQTNVEKSGSCALVMLFVNSDLYIANIGDCRAIIKDKNKKNAASITRDHKPEDPLEQERVIKGGGQVSKSNMLNIMKLAGISTNCNHSDLPYRIYPGGLSVSRSFGDVMAKESQLGGNPNVLIARPDLYHLKIQPTTEYFFVGCDGIYDKSTTDEIGHMIDFKLSEKETKGKTIQNICESTVNHVIMSNMKKASYDNLTGIFIMFRENF